jgi:hypothetical protein
MKGPAFVINQQMHPGKFYKRGYIKMGFQEAGCEGIDWIELAQDKDR